MSVRTGGDAAGIVILGVDASRAGGLRTGVGRVVEYLLGGWAGREWPFECIRLFTRTPLGDSLSDERFEEVVLPSRGPGIWWQLARLSPHANRCDVLLSPYTLPPGLRVPAVVYSLGIYEGAHRIPGARARWHSALMARSARRAEALLAIAPMNRRDLSRHYGVPIGAIRIAWPGLDRRFGPATGAECPSVDATVAEVLGESPPFFLFVGKPAGRRQIGALLEAFGRVVESRPQLRFVLVAPGARGAGLVSCAERLGIGGLVHFVDDLPRAALVALYQQARAFLMPTTHEGWSLTMQEAMACGCPILTVRGATIGVVEFLEEALGIQAAHGVIFEADNPGPDALARAMARLADDDELCATLRGRLLQCAETFWGWEQTAAEVMDACASVAEARR